MEKVTIAFVGPKGSGKSTTLLESYYFAEQSGKTARFIDLMCINQNYPPSDGRGIYFFVDNAQRLRNEKLKSVQQSLVGGKLCLAFSSSTYTSDGVSYLNCGFGAMDVVPFVPFTTNELES